MKKVVVRTFTTTPNEVGRFGSSQEFIPRHYTMPELIKIIQNSEKNTIQTENMFGSITAMKPETVTFCNLKKDITGKLSADDNFFSGNIHEKMEYHSSLINAKWVLDSCHEDESLMELLQ